VRSNSDLIDAVLCRGDDLAFETLVLRYERLVWTTAWRVLRDYHATQDATQETFLIAHARLAELRDASSLGFWLARIAAREALRVAKQRLKAGPLDGLDPPAPDASPRINAEFQALLDAIGELPEHERVVTVLRHLNGHSVQEVAELTGRPVGTVTKQLSRALKRLKAEFSKPALSKHGLSKHAGVNSDSCTTARLPHVP